MIVKCAWCKKFQGVKPPILSVVVTHGMCKPCFESIKSGYQKAKKPDKAANRAG
jgi:hypothetical protein